MKRNDLLPLSPIERIWTQQRINSRIKNNNKKSSPFLLFPSPQGKTKKEKRKKEERMKEMGMIPSKITQKGPQNLLRSI